MVRMSIYIVMVGAEINNDDECYVTNLPLIIYQRTCPKCDILEPHKFDGINIHVRPGHYTTQYILSLDNTIQNQIVNIEITKVLDLRCTLLMFPVMFISHTAL